MRPATLRLGRWVAGSHKFEKQRYATCDLVTRSLGHRVAKGEKPKGCDLATLRLGCWVTGSQKVEKTKDVRPVTLRLGRWVAGSQKVKN